MEDEGGLSFDFEGGLEAGPTSLLANHSISSDNHLAASTGANISSNFNGGSNLGGVGSVQGSETGPRRSFRQTVCRHWLRSLCMKGDACGFLHQYDKTRMPVCRFFRLYGECREQDCVYKHTNDDIKECNMYKLGFCPNGPDCRYRHAKLPGPPPSVEEALQKIQQLSSHYGGQNKYFHPRAPSLSQQPDKQQGSNTASQVLAQRNSVLDPPSLHLPQQQQQAGLIPQQQVTQSHIQNAPNGAPNQENRASTPLPPGISRYFIVKSCNRENLELSVQQGVWATQRSNEAKLNEAFDTAENVILVFSVNRTRHFQGCAKMTSKIGGTIAGGNWKYQQGTAHYGRNFSVKWLKLCELSFHKTRHLRNPLNENLPVKISRDCQELEPPIGEQLASLLYLEPDSELMAVAVAAEAKRMEEKAKGLNQDDEVENPDIVPFEDNEEEEEEESEEEDEYNQALAAGRGRGRGFMWPPNMPLPRGARPIPGMRGFPAMMMGGADGFSYNNSAQDSYGMQDLYGMGPRGFVPFPPRFPGDFSGPGAGMVFPGRPPQHNVPFSAGFGMMMGPGRPPFMPPNQARGNKPSSGSPYPPQMVSSQSSGRPVKRDPREVSNGRNPPNLHDDENFMDAKSYSDSQFKNSFHNEGSESEDEAPRRSRHGEGKKKRRGSEENSGAIPESS